MTDHVLYRFFNSSDQLLYIGITMNPPSRFRAHASNKSWWSEVSRITVSQFESRTQLAKAERDAIKAEKPKYNVMHNKDYEGLRSTPTTESRSSNPLVGKFLHFPGRCTCGRRIAEKQGHVVDLVAPRIYLIEFFSWLDGAPVGQQLWTLEELMQHRPVMYENNLEMIEAARIGDFSHTFQNIDCPIPPTPWPESADKVGTQTLQAVT